jgi:hypothetical protein
MLNSNPTNHPKENIVLNRTYCKSTAQKYS